MAAAVAQRIRDLYFHADPAVKAAANAELVRFQDTDQAWAVSYELLADADVTLQFIGGQMLLHKCAASTWRDRECATPP